MEVGTNFPIDLREPRQIQSLHFHPSHMTVHHLHHLHYHHFHLLLLVQSFILNLRLGSLIRQILSSNLHRSFPLLPD